MKNNKVIITTKDAKLILSDRRGELIAVGLISVDDIEIVSKKYWYIAAGGYICSERGRNYLHRFLMNPKPGISVDHINMDKLDNRRINLRFATKSQNGMNKPAAGISYNKLRNQWEAFLGLNNKKVHLGWFKTEEEAHLARKVGEKKYFKEYAYKAL